MWISLKSLSVIYNLPEEHFIKWCLERYKKYKINYNSGEPEVLTYNSNMLISHYKELNDKR